MRHHAMFVEVARLVYQSELSCTSLDHRVVVRHPVLFTFTFVKGACGLAPREPHFTSNLCLLSSSSVHPSHASNTTPVLDGSSQVHRRMGLRLRLHLAVCLIEI